MTEEMDGDSDSLISHFYEEDFLPVVYAEDPPKSLLCPLCGNVFEVRELIRGWDGECNDADTRRRHSALSANGPNCH